MIISRTPFRMSFVGGGTDLPSFCAREPGAVISTAIDKYVYITVNRRFDQSLRISYSQTEIVDNVAAVEHPLFRETMRETGVDSGIEVTSIADVPSGTGLGSSSSFTVGLLHAVHAFAGRFRSATELARQACRLEIDVLKEPIGNRINMPRRLVVYGAISLTLMVVSSWIPLFVLTKGGIFSLNTSCCST
jgi:D-glycero-alpha-D-manno-heptose-7-phosphate kinase